MNNENVLKRLYKRFVVPIVVPIKEKFVQSVLWCCIKALFCVFLIVWIIFLIAPNSAHIFFRAEETQYISDIEAKNIRIETECKAFNLLTQNKINVCFAGGKWILSDGKVYDDSYILSFSPTALHNSVIYASIMDEELETATIKEMHTRDEEGQVKIRELGDTACINFDSGLEMCLSQTTMLEFGNADAHLVNEAGEEIAVSKCYVSNNSPLYYITVDFPVELKLYDIWEPTMPTTNMHIEKISKLSTRMSGDLQFSYTPSITEIRAEDQIVELGSKTHDLEMYLNYKSGIQYVDVSGMVDKASISNMDLFPSFRGWYRGSVLMAPMTLMSTIILVAQMMRKKEK